MKNGMGNQEPLSGATDFRIDRISHKLPLRLMVEIRRKHQLRLVVEIPLFTTGFIHPGWCKISAINSISNLKLNHVLASGVKCLQLPLSSKQMKPLSTGLSNISHLKLEHVRSGLNSRLFPCSRGWSSTPY